MIIGKSIYSPQGSIFQGYQVKNSKFSP